MPFPSFLMFRSGPHTTYTVSLPWPKKYWGFCSSRGTLVCETTLSVVRWPTSRSKPLVGALFIRQMQWERSICGPAAWPNIWPELDTMLQSSQCSFRCCRRGSKSVTTIYHYYIRIARLRQVQVKSQVNRGKSELRLKSVRVSLKLKSIRTSLSQD